MILCFFIGLEYISEQSTVFLQLNAMNSENLDYQSGDHLAICPQNDQELIKRFIRRLKNCPDFLSIVQLQVADENNNWSCYKRIPPCSFEKLLACFVDLTCPPNQSTLQLLATATADPKTKGKLIDLAEVIKQNEI